MSSATVQGVVHSAVMMALVRGHPPATPFLLALNRLGGPQFSRVIAIEMLSNRQADAGRSLALRFIGTSSVLDLTDTIARRAVDILTAVPLPTVLTAAAAIVAATAIEHSSPLYTLDPARFAAAPGLATAKPY